MTAIKYGCLCGFALLLVISARAQDGHRLILYSEDSARFTVALNEVEEMETASSRVELSGIAEDNPELLIRFENRVIPELHKSRLKIGDARAANNPEYTAIYALRKKGRGYELRLIKRFIRPGEHGVFVEQDAKGTSVEISNPGRVRIRTHP